MPMVIANINVGVLFVFAVASLGVYGIVIAGWSSNSKYPFLGGVRSTSQMISYELSLGLSVIPLFLIMGELNLPKIVEYQIAHGWTIVPFTNLRSCPARRVQRRTIHTVAGCVNWRQVLLWVPMLISFFVSSRCPSSRRRTACPSTCRKRKPNSSPVTTRNTRR